MKKFLLRSASFVFCTFAGATMAQVPSTYEQNGRRAIGIPSAPTPTPGCFDGWSATSTTNAPYDRAYHTAVWTGSEMIVWGGNPTTNFTPNLGRIYHPDTDSWTAVSGTNSPGGRLEHTAVWTGSEMIIWGGYSSTNFNNGGRYNPGTDTWTATSTTNAPSARAYQVAVWTGSEMIVWGGYNGTVLNSGGRYNPTTDTWTATSNTNAPSGRSFHKAVWTGSEMIVWGGYDGTSVFGSGGRYNPVTDTWTVTSTTNAPASRAQHTAVWTGSEMIVWGGYGGSDLNSGGRYDPGADTWVATSVTGAPTGRSFPSAVWTGSEMIVWGGYDTSSAFNTGGRYNPGSNSWTASSTLNAPSGRSNHTVVWTGSQMIVWGGVTTGGVSNTGGRYCAEPSTPTPGTLGNISTRLRVLSGDNALIGGMIATGTAGKRVIIRAIGPSLTPLGVPGALANPTLELFQGSTLLFSNDDWNNSTQQVEIAASGLAPSNPAEAAIIWTLTPGQGYTAVVRGQNGTTGVGIVEVYDLDQTAASKLGNISTRGFVDVDDNVMIAGLIAGPGNGTSLKVLVRALGPTLSDLGVPGALANPTLDLVNSSGTVIRSNNDWKDDPLQRAAIEAAGLGPSHDEEAALVETVPPGAYTAVVRGSGRATGVGLVEAYNIP